MTRKVRIYGDSQASDSVSMILPPLKRKNSGRRTSFRGWDEEEGEGYWGQFGTCCFSAVYGNTWREAWMKEKLSE